LQIGNQDYTGANPMADFNSQINKLVEEFVSQVTAVARQAAMDTLTTALGSAAAAGRGRAAPLVAARPAVAAPGGGRGARRPKGAKRPPDEIEQTMAQVQEFIQKHPGLRIEQINKQLGTQTKDLALPLRKLISDGMVRTEGEKRSTQYFPGDGKGKGKGAAPKRRKRK
jgi:hypothetical protein